MRTLDGVSFLIFVLESSFRLLFKLKNRGAVFPLVSCFIKARAEGRGNICYLVCIEHDQQSIV